MANRKGHSKSAIFLIYSIFSNKNQMSLFLHKAYDKLITTTGKTVGVHARWWAIAVFSNWQSSMSKQFRHVFNVRVHEGEELP